jgi:eukaryotic-like serine/threonine-protein kinase
LTISPEEAKRLAEVLWDEPEPAEPLVAGPIGAGFRVSRYTIESLIAMGGMGAVYRAASQTPPRAVALKVIKPERLSPSAANRFRRETELLDRLDHPGIAQLFETGSVRTDLGEQPFFAMEFVAGKPLLEHVDGTNLDTRARLELFLKVCNAVEHAHRAGVIHRDIKPSNVLVTEEGEPKVLDFGVAKATDAELHASTRHSGAGHFVGTLHYMSPEQAVDEPADLDTRTDVYSLGVLLYQLLCGHLPYDVDKRQVAASLRTIREEPPAPMGNLDPSLRGIEPVVRKALEKDRDRRYQSASDLAAAIRNVLDAPGRLKAIDRVIRWFSPNATRTRRPEEP